MSGAMNLSGRTAVVTGAAGGIGRAIAVSLARRGCHLALADIDEPGLVGTMDAVAPGVRASRHRLDVSDPDAIAEFPARVAAEHGAIHLLINNAGVAIGGTFEQIAPADFEWLFSINFWGVVRMTRAFLPVLKLADESRIVNLSSVYGLIAPARQSAYVASKFAVRGFSESLRHELAGTGVGVTVVHPGGIATSIAKRARIPAAAPPEEVEREQKWFQAQLKMPAAEAGETIVRAVEHRKARVIVGNDAKFAALIERLAPVAHMSFLDRRRL